MRDGSESLAAKTVARRLTKQDSARPPASLRKRLQLATQDLHADVERHLALNRPGWSAQSYRHVLERFWGIYLPLEQRLDALDWSQSGVVFSARRKAPWLAADLDYFGLEPASLCRLDTCDALPRLDSLAAGLGALYVLEGATLGGQVILRDLLPQLGLSREAGGRFFASYGPDTGVMWRDYLAVLENHGDALETADAITQSAIETFSAFARWFSRPNGWHANV